MADILDTTLRTDLENIRYLYALLNEYDLYQEEISALSLVGFSVHMLTDINDGVVNRSNEAIKESHVITANKMNSLFKHAREVDIFPSYARPAVVDAVLIIQENDFLANATRNAQDTGYTYEITKENFVTIGAYIFSFDYDIRINLFDGALDPDTGIQDKYLTAYYDIKETKNPLSDLVNPTIKAIRQKVKNGWEFQLYFNKDTALKQYHREYTTSVINNRDMETFPISTKRTTDHIADIEVWHIPNAASNSGQMTKLNKKMHFESSRTDEDTIFLQFNNANSLRLVHKSQQGGFRPRTGDSFYTVLYCTTGSEAEFVFNNLSGDNIKFNYTDENDLFTKVVLINGIVSGGMTYDTSKHKLRKDIIVKKSTRDSIVTENDLSVILVNRNNSSAENLNTYSVIKNRNDIIKIFNIFTSLNFQNDNSQFTIPTNTLDVNWNYVQNGWEVENGFYLLKDPYVGSDDVNKGTIMDFTTLNTAMNSPAPSTVPGTTPAPTTTGNSTLGYRVPFILAYDKNNNIIRVYDNYVQERVETEYKLHNYTVPYSYICNWVSLSKDDQTSKYEIRFQLRINVTGTNPKEKFFSLDSSGNLVDEKFIKCDIVFYDNTEAEIFRVPAEMFNFVSKDDDEFFTYVYELLPEDKVDPVTGKVKYGTKIYRDSVEVTWLDWSTIDPSTKRPVIDASTGKEKTITRRIPIENLKGVIEVKSATSRSILPDGSPSPILDTDERIINTFTFKFNLLNIRTKEFKIQNIVLGNDTIKILQLPLVQLLFYMNHRDIYRTSIAREYYMENYVKKYQGEFSFSIKFNNTYGYSAGYKIGLGEKKLNNLQLDMKFLVEKKLESSLSEKDLSNAVYAFLQTIDFANFEEMHISNLYDYLFNQFPNDLKLIQFLGMNGYSPEDQIISPTFKELKNNTIIEKLTLPLTYNPNDNTFGFKVNWVFRTTTNKK